MSHAIHTQLIQVAERFNPNLALALANVGPLHIAGRRDEPFALVLCRAVAGQQLSVKAAATIWGRFLEQLKGHDLVGFLLETEIEQLRLCGLSAAKSRSIKAIAEAVKTGALDTNSLAKLESNERRKRLTAIWGVGPWTADMMSISYFGDPDIWPDGDVTARKTFLKFCSGNQGSIEASEAFKPYRSYLAMAMWRIADADPVN